MSTTIKELPGHQQVATSVNNIVTQVVNRVTEFQVGPLNFSSNQSLDMENTYSLTDDTNQSLVVKVLHLPGGGMMTATFVLQT